LILREREKKNEKPTKKNSKKKEQEKANIFLSKNLSFPKKKTENKRGKENRIQQNITKNPKSRRQSYVKVPKSQGIRSSRCSSDVVVKVSDQAAEKIDYDVIVAGVGERGGDDDDADVIIRPGRSRWTGPARCRSRSSSPRGTPPSTAFRRCSCPSS